MVPQQRLLRGGGVLAGRAECLCDVGYGVVRQVRALLQHERADGVARVGALGSNFLNAVGEKYGGSSQPV